MHRSPTCHSGLRRGPAGRSEQHVLPYGREPPLHHHDRWPSSPNRTATCHGRAIDLEPLRGLNDPGAAVFGVKHEGDLGVLRLGDRHLAERRVATTSAGQRIVADLEQLGLSVFDRNETR